MSEGTKHDQGKLRYDLIPPDVMDEIAYVLTYGASKYSARNWELGMEWGRNIGAAERHINAFKARERLDGLGGGTHHLANAIVELMFVLAFDLREIGTDDRGVEVKLPRRPQESGTGVLSEYRGGTVIYYTPGGLDDPTKAVTHRD